MKILLSAYACRPQMGSEPAVGWTWVVELSKYHELWVLTNYTNQEKIDEYYQANDNGLSNVHFIYVRPNKKLTFLHEEWGRLERYYYVLWQKKAYKIAKELNSNVHFDYIQHLTYVTCILPTYMHKLGIPFIYGPVSGGERIPAVIRYPMSLKHRLIELIRSLTQLIPAISLNTRRAFKKAEKIIAVTEETKKLIPKKYHHKVILEQAIGLKSEYFEPAPAYVPNASCRVLMVGRMIYWKGFETGINAVKKALEQDAPIELTVLGGGNKKHIEKLKKLAAIHLDTKIKFVDSIGYEKMKSFYESFDVLLNCSLRDSGCLVVMEAMSRGLPVICIDTGGPKMNTSNECALKITPVHFSKLIESISHALINFAKNPEYRSFMSRAAYQYARDNFNIEVKVRNFLEHYA